VTVLWGTIPLIVRHLPLPGVSIAAARLAIATAGLGLVVAIQARRRPSTLRLLAFRPLSCLAVGAVLAVHWVTLFEAYKRTEISTVILIVYLAPVGVALLAPRALGEHVGRGTWAALAVAVTGFAILAVPTVGDASRSGVALAVVSGLLFVALILVSKPLAEAYGGVRTAFIEFAGAALLLSPVLVTTAWGRLDGGQWGWLIVLGLVHTGATVAAYLFALARVPATNTGIMGYIEPVSAVLFSWWQLHEPLRWTSVAGGALIVAAGIAVVRGSRPVPPLEVPTHAAG
jgi:drug/metabolite transporter (DMT)-like permease